MLDLTRPLIDHPRADRHRHRRGRHRQTVRGLVGEGRRSLRLLLRHVRNLQSAPPTGTRHGTKLGLRERARRQHVTVVVRVVIQHRQQRRTTRSDTDFVVDGNRRRVLLVALGFRDLLALVRCRSVLFLLLGRVLLVPVVDHDHVLIGKPQRASCHIIENDTRPIRPEHH